jgi:hypothetical protein
MKHTVTGILSIGLAIAAATLSAQELALQQAGQYMAAAGEVFAAQRTMEGITKVCGENAARLSTVWNDRNKAAITKAGQLRSAVLRDIEKLKDAQAAREFKEKQDKFLAEKVAASIREIDTLPPEKKKHICGRYVETVNQGQWDISQNAGLYNLLMNAK